MDAGPPRWYRAASPSLSGWIFPATGRTSSAPSTTVRIPRPPPAPDQGRQSGTRLRPLSDLYQGRGKDGELDGEIEVTRRLLLADGRGEPPARGAARSTPSVTFLRPSAAVANVPSIDGVWEIPYDSNKGEKAWRLIVQQKGADVSATVLRVDGDTGALTGSWQDGKFVASHFDGARPGLIQLRRRRMARLAVDLKTPPRTGDVGRLPAGGSPRERSCPSPPTTRRTPPSRPQRSLRLTAFPTTTARSSPTTTRG